MRYLLDTNVLLRVVDLSHPHHLFATRLLRELRKEGHTFCVVLQNLSEFWNVCTRPLEMNGLGLSVAEAAGLLDGFERFLEILPDTLEVYRNWRVLIS